MKDKALSPAVTGIIIAVAIAVVVLIGWRSLGERNDGPKEPINMGKIMGAKGGAPGTGGSGVSRPTGPPHGAIHMGGG